MNFKLNMTPSQVRAEVRDYHDKSPFGLDEPDCFMPWYLQHVCLLGYDNARIQSSNGKDDFGIDGFYLEAPEQAGQGYILNIFQAKHTSEKPLVHMAIKEFTEASLPKLSELLSGAAPSKYDENQVIKNLRSYLSHLSRDEKEQLSIRFIIIHLLDKSADEIKADCEEENNKLREQFIDTLPKNKFLGCDFLDYQKNSIPLLDCWIQTEGTFIQQADQDRRVFFGVASLSDILSLYETCGDDIFEENVRYFIASRKNLKEEGPVGNMWLTLKRICVTKELTPEIFAVYHNGICICCAGIENKDGKVRLNKPKIVNGCQTVKGISQFRNDEKAIKKTEKFDAKLWKAIRIPIRIVETSKEEIIYQIAINNNRQNAIDSTALRSNDAIQRKLKDNFKVIGIFYERQKEEYKNLSLDDEIDLLEEYPNTTTNEPITIQELGQALAAVKGIFDAASSPSLIFESNERYKKVFGEKQCPYSLNLLIALRNLEGAIQPALKSVKDTIGKYDQLNPRTLKWIALYLTIRYLCKHERDFLNDISKMTKRSSDMQEDVVKLLKRSGILQLIHKVYLSDPDVGQNELGKEVRKCNMWRIN